MGEIAEMMLDGTLCECCGVLIISEGEEPQGFSGYCSDQCRVDRGLETLGDEEQEHDYQCATCGKGFGKEHSLRQHARDKHGRGVEL